MNVVIKRRAKIMIVIIILLYLLQFKVTSNEDVLILELFINY